MAVLGPVDLRRDGTRLAVPAGKTTEVLIRLALDAGVLVRAERLIDDLWSEQAAGVARNTLQSKVSQLRRALGDPGLVTGGAAGYTLHVDPAQVDALEVLRLADAAAELRESGNAAAAVTACTDALAMFRGEILPAGAGDWLIPHRARLEQVRLRLAEDHLAARLDLGAGGEVIGELESLVAIHPLRESLWRLLITALYRAGRQADALEAYRRIRERLAEDLGVDPGPELRAVERRILLHDRRLTAPRHRGNLPALTGSLVGRAADLRAVGRLVDEHRLVTVVGPAGVGKTRLALEAAAQRRDTGGAWLVRLESTPAGAALWPAVGEAFALSGATEAVVLDRLRGVDALLVLDNCEHLVDEVPELVDRLLEAVPGLRVLATSQLPLGLDALGLAGLGLAGEVTYPLEPLSIADSAMLFRDRAVRHRRSFQASDDTVAAVCRALDGLPLAIELAAARAKALSADEIARRLDDRFTLLNDPTSRRPARRRTLRAAIGWSYDLLFPDDQYGLWALSCFAGGAPLAAVEEVLAALGVPAASAVDVVGRLADRSLLGVDPGPGDTVRYRLLDSVREFGRDQLRAAGRAETAHAAYAAWYGAAADRAAAGIHGPEQARHLAFVRTERANIDAALAWTRGHDPGLGLRIANGFGWAWIMLGADPGAALRAALVAAGPAAPIAERVDGLLFDGWFEAVGGNLDRAIADIDEAIAIADDDALRARGHLFLAFAHTQGGRPEVALAALDRQRAALHGWEAGAAWLLTAWSEIARGRLERGRAACVEVSRLLEPHGDAWALSHAEAILGGLAQAQRRFPDAIAHLRRAADAAHRLGFSAAEALHLANLGRAYQQAGEPETAVRSLMAAVETAHGVGDRRTAALAGVRLGRVLRALGRSDDARVEVAAAREWFRAAGGGDGALLADHLAAALGADLAAPRNGDLAAASGADRGAVSGAGRGADRAVAPGVDVVAVSGVDLSVAYDADPAAGPDADRIAASDGNLAAAPDGGLARELDDVALAGVLAAARAAGDREVEVLTLDRLALLHAEHGHAASARELLATADDAVSTVEHLVTGLDRVDAIRARILL